MKRRQFIKAGAAGLLIPRLSLAMPGSPYLSYGKRYSGGGGSAPPTLINHWTGDYTGVTISGISANDVLIFIASGRNSGPGTLTWTPAATDFATRSLDGGNNGVLLVSYYVASGGETSVSFADSSVNPYKIYILQVRGVDTAAVPDFTTNVVSASATSVTSGSVTPGHNNSFLLAVTMEDPGTTQSIQSTASSTTTATGTTNAWTDDLFSTAGTRSVNIGVGHTTQTTAGAITVTGSQTNSDATPKTYLWTIGLKSATP